MQYVSLKITRVVSFFPTGLIKLLGRGEDREFVIEGWEREWIAYSPTTVHYQDKYSKVKNMISEMNNFNMKSIIIEIHPPL